MSCGLIAPSISGSPARTRSPSCTLMWIERGTRYSRVSPRSLSTMTLRMPLWTSPRCTTPSIGDDRRLLGAARLEQLDDARQAAGDVLGLRRLARDLHQRIAGVDLAAVLHHEVRARRQQVALVA